MDEEHFSEIDAAMLYIEEARARAERHLIEALERTQEQLEDAHRTLMQGTLFAVPSAQTSI